MQSPLKAAAMLGLAAAALLGAAASPQAAENSARSCFSMRDWNGWKASPDGKTIYIRTGVNRFYRLDFRYACPAAGGIGVHLVTKTRGGAWVCDPLDLDLKVSDGRGFTTPCLVSGITALSAQEAAALPRGLKP